MKVNAHFPKPRHTLSSLVLDRDQNTHLGRPMQKRASFSLSKPGQDITWTSKPTHSQTHRHRDSVISAKPTHSQTHRHRDSVISAKPTHSQTHWHHRHTVTSAAVSSFQYLYWLCLSDLLYTVYCTQKGTSLHFEWQKANTLTITRSHWRTGHSALLWLACVHWWSVFSTHCCQYVLCPTQSMHTVKSRRSVTDSSGYAQMNTQSYTSCCFVLFCLLFTGDGTSATENAKHVDRRGMGTRSQPPLQSAFR
jgi:hypothetical protein